MATTAMKTRASIPDMHHVAHRAFVCEMVRNLDDFGKLRISLQAGIAAVPAVPTPSTGPERPMGVHTKRKAACVATSGPAIAGRGLGGYRVLLPKTIAISGSIERR
jgi:hypothetical protein